MKPANHNSFTAEDTKSIPKRITRPITEDVDTDRQTQPAPTSHGGPVMKTPGILQLKNDSPGKFIKIYISPLALSILLTQIFRPKEIVKKDFTV